MVFSFLFFPFIKREKNPLVTPYMLLWMAWLAGESTAGLQAFLGLGF